MISRLDSDIANFPTELLARLLVALIEMERTWPSFNGNLAIAVRAELDRRRK